MKAIINSLYSLSSTTGNGIDNEFDGLIGSMTSRENWSMCAGLALNLGRFHVVQSDECITSHSDTGLSLTDERNSVTAKMNVVNDSIDEEIVDPLPRSTEPTVDASSTAVDVSVTVATDSPVEIPIVQVVQVQQKVYS